MLEELKRHAVTAAFERLNCTPRGKQYEVTLAIVDQFIEREIQNIILDAPTGSGKSIIGAAVSLALVELKQITGSVIVTATNALSEQYSTSLNIEGLVGSVKGADNYTCPVREAIEEKEVSALLCAKSSPFFKPGTPSYALRGYCDSECDYNESRRWKRERPVIVTNTSYFLVDRMWALDIEGAVTFSDRSLYIIDEAHRFPDEFANHCAIYFSEQRLDALLKDYAFLLGKDVASNVDAFLNPLERMVTLISNNRIPIQKDLDDLVIALKKIYELLFTAARSLKSYANDEDEYDNFRKLEYKYHGMFCKTDDYFKFWQQEAASQVTEKPLELVIKPIFPKRSFERISGRWNLFMSATVHPDLLITALDLDPEKTLYFRIPSEFNPSDKKVVIPDGGGIPINHQNKNNPEVLDAIAKACQMIMIVHRGRNGVIIANSFEMVKNIAPMISGQTHNVIAHTDSKIGVLDLIQQLKDSAVPSVLISPSLHEGIDLPGDISRFQIITKCPYPTLSDPRTKKIFDNYHGAYTLMALMKLIQSLGRSTRHNGDRSVSYILDAHAVRLFRSHQNRWKNQFEIFTRKIF